MAAPIAMPTAIPTASQALRVPSATDRAAPNPAPSATPSPICVDFFFMFLLRFSRDGRGRPSSIIPLFRRAGDNWKRVGLHWLIADQSDFRQQVGHAHSGEGL